MMAKAQEMGKQHISETCGKVSERSLRSRASRIALDS